MYNWIDGRKFSDAKNLSTLSFLSKNCISFIKNPFELNNFNRLPVIKEEEGYVTEDELEESKNLSGSTSLKRNSVSHKSIHQNESSTNMRNVQMLKESKPLTRLPPLVNINCMMNTEIKQTKSIWDTKFGKRLMYGKNEDEGLNNSVIKKIRPNSANNFNEKPGGGQLNKAVSKRKSIRARSDNNGGGDKRDFSEINTTKKKSKTTNKGTSKPAKKVSKVEMECEKKNFKSVDSEKELVKFTETLTNEIPELSPTTSSARNQRFLTECVHSILEGRANQITCEHCNKSFLNIEELFKHRKQHESEKETCLLCGKIFFNPNDFIQHLLSHEGVDKFSCKKCKKYFPNLKKYKNHCLEHHCTPLDNNCQETQLELESIKKWVPRFECKRCKIEFDSEEKQKAHRRNHIKKDLVGAYLLSPKNM